VDQDVADHEVEIEGLIAGMRALFAPYAGRGLAEQFQDLFPACLERLQDLSHVHPNLSVRGVGGGDYRFFLIEKSLNPLAENGLKLGQVLKMLGYAPEALAATQVQLFLWDVRYEPGQDFRHQLKAIQYGGNVFHGGLLMLAVQGVAMAFTVRSAVTVSARGRPTTLV
jgi:hypothetical protein